MPSESVPPQLDGPFPDPGALEARLHEADRFLRDMAPHLGRLFGVDLTVTVTQLPEGAGMATSETGDFLVDPRFFLDRDYTPEQATYGTLHEVAAHMKATLQAPQHTARVLQFSRQGKPQHIFNNIFEDIAGNKLIHAVLPRMQGVAEDLYRDRLFPDDPPTDVVPDETTEPVIAYKDLPRHLQFLYKIIREEMIPDSQTEVSPEVQAAIDGLRDYQGQGDVLKYSTAVAKSAREAMSPEERFQIWQAIVYPEYVALLEQDRQDPRFQKSPEQQQGEPDPNAQPGQQGEQGEPQPGDADPQGKPQKGQSAEDAKKFGQFYEDYEQNKHPEPMSHEEQDKMRAEAAKRQRERQHPTNKHERVLDERLRQETGHGLQEQRRYNAEIVKWQGAIEEMREAFSRIIQERVTLKRGLTRNTLPEGAILDPDRLSQVVVDRQAGDEHPDVFRDYEIVSAHGENIGKTDYVFLFDVSGSMGQNGKNKAAASTGVIGLEGLAALQRDVEEAEAQHKIELDLDIRTAIYTFGEGSSCLKPLSTTVTQKERLDAYAALSKPNGAKTHDFMGLEAIEGLPDEDDRRRILIVVSDGESDDPARARRAVDRLRGKGWFVYGVSIGSDDAENLYRPTAKRVDDPALLPQAIQTFLEATIQ